MKKILFILLVLLLISCDDAPTGTNPIKSKCVDGCAEWEKCDETNSVCILKEGRCDKDKTENCKDDTPICNEESHKCVASDKCNPNPCSKENRTKCELSTENSDGYICNCSDGFELKDDKCVKKDFCDPNPCTEENKTECEISEDGTKAECHCDEGHKLEDNKCVKATCSDECTKDECTDSGLRKCEYSEITGCRELTEAVPCGDHMICDVNHCTCDNSCDESTKATCVANGLVSCKKDVEGCFYLDTKVCASGCDNSKDEPFCKCEECVVEDFDSKCNGAGYIYCKDDNGCFSIEEVDCEAGTHCVTDPELSCVENTCSDECTKEGFDSCKMSGGASIIVNCEKNNEDGCMHKVNGTNCTSLNMECNAEIKDCLGGDGDDKCSDNTKEILVSGLWYGTTKLSNDDYKGCGREDNFNGLDKVYKIKLELGQTIKLSLKEREPSSITTIKPIIYVRKSCENMDIFCKKALATETAKPAELKYTAGETGTYYIITDREKGGIIDITKGYDFEMLIDIQ